MKRFKLLVLTFLLILSTLSPMTVHAEGNGNINNGGGGLGGCGNNFGQRLGRIDITVTSCIRC